MPILPIYNLPGFTITACCTSRGFSAVHRQLARVAAIWVLLLAGLVHSRDYPRGLSQLSNSTNPTMAAEPSLSEDEPKKAVTPSRHHKRDSVGFEIDIANGQPPVAAEDGAPANTTIPSPRCASREEWQGGCRVWSGKPHNRYLEFKKLNKGEGIGANLMRIAWALNRAISFDLEPIFIGPFRAGHGAGDFGGWVGITNNSQLVIQDPEGFKRASNEVVPFPEGDGDDWFREQENRTSVVYKVKPIRVKKIKDWGVPVSLPNSDPRVCTYVRQALRDIYWSAPPTRGRCHAMLPVGHHTRPEGATEGTTTGYKRDGKRPWVVAVHVRRGDMIHFRGGRRSVPHRYFSAAVRSVLQGIAVTDPAAHVSVLVFSEGPDTLEGLQLHDEHGKTITWDIEHESCVGIGLMCTQEIFLKTSVYETFDCLAAADVIVGSESSYSEADAAVSTNVKVMIWENQTEQDRVTLDSTAAALSGEVSNDEQAEMNTAIAEWWYCSEEVQRSTGSDQKSMAARRFYQIVDEGLSSR